MKKIFTIGCMLLTGIGLFAGEFNFREFNTLNAANDLTGMKKYVEQNGTITEKTFKKVYQLLCAKLIVLLKVDKTITADNVFQTIDQLVDQEKTLSDNQKLSIKVQLYLVCFRFAELKPVVDKKLVEIGNDNQKLAAVTNDMLSPNQIWSLYIRRADFNSSSIVKAAKFNPINAFKLAVNKKLDKQIIIAVTNTLIEHVNTIRTPAQLTGVIAVVSKLNSLVYDESVKTLLTVLNRHCYPKIQVSEDWKKAVVQLQLVMKAYNL